MIKLERPAEVPACISGQAQLDLVAEYIATKKPVWQIDELKAALLETSNNKCAYCETRLGVADSYLEVEHFYCKNIYDDKVVTWTNLLPSCKRCNSTKSNHDVGLEPIINPYDINPLDHFKFDACRLAPTTKIGKETIDALNLNDVQKLGILRFSLSGHIREAISVCNDALERYTASGATRTKNSLAAKISALLLECQPSSEYAAIASTVLHSDPIYYKVIKNMKHLQLWTDDMEASHASSRAIALDVQGLI